MDNRDPSAAIQVSHDGWFRGKEGTVPRALRVLAILASLAVLLGAAPAVLGGGPTRDVLDLDDPAFDIEEAAFWTQECGFEVGVDNSGHITTLAFPAGNRKMLQIDSYHIYVTYWNVETGRTIKLRDVGPDRVYLRGGRAYIAVTGRSLTGTGTIGQVVIDLETDEIVHQAGREVGLFQDQLCAALGA
jgi:hypothetical protein